MIAACALTGALLIAIPVGATDAAAPRTGPGSAVAAVQPEPVRPDVRDTVIPAVSARRSAPGVAASLTGDGHSEALAAHVEVPAAEEFSMLGVTWAAGSGDEHVTALVRTRSGTTWSDWTELHTDPDEGPAADEDLTTRDGTGVLFVDDADGVEVSVYTESGRAPSALEVNTIDPGVSAADGTVTTETTTETQVAPEGGFPVIPDIVTRREWGADPSLGDRCWPPRYGTTFKNVFVHHTVSSNDYTRAESAGIVRGIYAYHTQSRGWCDIGYNFLVDRYGTVYEGRRGGIRLPVRGAHAGDYNTNSTGISLIGNFETAYPTRRMKTALVSLIAWRMGTAYRGAYGKAFIYDRKFKRISGHRDAMATACPGQHVYDWLPGLRSRVAARLGDYESIIETTWRNRGGPGGALGQVRIGERAEAGGRWTAFTHGRMYRKDGRTRVLAQGAILAAFKGRGGVGGPLKYPTSAVHPTRDERGTLAVFEHGRIWWSRSTHARSVTQGPLLKRYKALGGASGRLGFPTSNNFATSRGARLNLEHGYLVYDRSTRKVTVTFR